MFLERKKLQTNINLIDCISKKMAVMKYSENDLKRRIKEETSDDEETSVSVPLPAKRSKDCPYLDSINRKVLDFGKSPSSPSQEFVQKI